MTCEPSRPPSEVGLIILGSLLYTAGSAILYVLPAYLGELSTRFGCNEAQLGTISGAENVGIALASLASLLWLARLNRRKVVLVGITLCVVFNLAAFFSRSVDGLILSRFLTGVCGEGILFAMAFVVLGSTRNPDRSFGIGLTVVVGFGSLVLAGSPFLDRVSLGTGALLPLAAVPLTALFALRFMPSRPAVVVPSGGPADRSGARHLALLAIVGMTVWFAAPGAFWTFAESAAAERRIPVAVISAALAIGNAAGLLGSVLAAWQGDRWGRFRPIMIASACLCLSVLQFQHSSSVIGMSSALAAFNVAWNYGAVYEMALVVALDPAGRAPLAISAAQVLGFAAGGFLSGIALVHSGYGALPAAVALFAIGGLAVLVWCFRVPTRQPDPR